MASTTMRPIAGRMVLMIFVAVCVVVVPLAYAFTIRIGADGWSWLGIVSIAAWIPLLILASIEGRVPRRETRINDDGAIEIRTWGRRPVRIEKERIRHLLLHQSDGVPWSMLYLESTDSNGQKTRQLIQRDPLVPSENQSLGIAESDGLRLSELLSKPLLKSNTIEDDQRFLECVRDGSGTTKAMLMLWLLSQVVGAIWNPYCRFVVLAGLIASPVVAGVQLAHRWKRSGKTARRALIGGICLFGGAAVFVTTVLYGGEGKWDAYRYGAMLSKLGTYGGLYIMVFGLSVTMGDARRDAS